MGKERITMILLVEYKVKPCNAAQVEDQGIPGDKSLHNLLLILG
jgi:hypothetical protein